MTSLIDRLKGVTVQGSVENDGSFTFKGDKLRLSGGPPAMNFPPPPAEYIPRSARRQMLGEKAARAAQYVDDLETEVEQLRAENSVFRETNILLHEANDSLKTENERLVRENTAIATRVEMAAEILLHLRKPVETNHVDPSEKAEAAIREALGQTPQPDHAGPEGRQAPSEDSSLHSDAGYELVAPLERGSTERS